MTNQSKNPLTETAFETLRSQVYQAMSAAHDQVQANRTERARASDRAEAKILADAPKRVADTIAAIPEAIRQQTAKALENPGMFNYDGFQCQVQIMSLECHEYSDSPGHADDYAWEERNRFQPPGETRYAARSVWDICEKGGLNPKICRGVHYGGKDGRGDHSQSEAYFYMVIRWNVPTELQIKAN
jgi:hypothetical protein